jgi:uncharacterized protein (DUF488 family)
MIAAIRWPEPLFARIGAAVGQFVVFTAGHGEQSFDDFAHMLSPYGIETIVDVRTLPYTEYAPWFNRDRLEHLTRRRGWEYLWLGGSLGSLTMDGRVDYIARERELRYREGISELLTLAHERRVCLLSSQPDPESSHRHQLIAQTLLRHDVEVRHILADGMSVAAQADLFHVGL